MAEHPLENTKISTRKVTMKEVAKHAGVSTSAVSKVIRNAYGVSDALRECVNNAIAELGYRPNTSARAMRGKTYSIGVLVISLENPYFSTLINGISHILNTQNYNFSIGVGQAESSLEIEIAENMIDKNVDGLIFISPRLSGGRLEQFGQRIPTVVIGHHELEAKNFDTINSDDRIGVKKAIKHLIEQGHTNIMMLSLEDHSKSQFDIFHEREKGYTETMREHSLEKFIKIIREEKPNYSLSNKFKQEIVNNPDVTAIFCWSDIHAIPVLDYIKYLHKNITVIGYDNTLVASLKSINLSSVEQFGFTQGECAAELLISRINGRKEAQHQKIEPSLIIR